MITTSSVEVQVPSLTVQRSVTVPAADTVAVDEGEVASLKVTVGVPLTFDHAPDPTAGVLPARVATNPHTL
jgi:hypothetical protein